MLLQQLRDNLTSENCFEIFKLSNSTLCLIDITNISLNLMMKELIEFYESNCLSENHEDPYIDRYKDMDINEIHMMINVEMNSSTIARIMITRNWWKINRNIAFKEEIFEILTQINAKACYIQKTRIIFMRKLRDTILHDINSLTITNCSKEKL